MKLCTQASIVMCACVRCQRLLWLCQHHGMTVMMSTDGVVWCGCAAVILLPRFEADRDKGDFSDLPELHALSSGLKATCTAITAGATAITAPCMLIGMLQMLPLCLEQRAAVCSALRAVPAQWLLVLGCSDTTYRVVLLLFD